MAKKMVQKGSKSRFEPLWLKKWFKKVQKAVLNFKNF